MIDQLQDQLQVLLESVFKDVKYNTKSGLKTVKINPQSLEDTSFEDDKEEYPYIILRILDGVDSINNNDPSTVRLLIAIGVYDDALDNQGYRDVISIMKKIRLTLLRKPSVGQMFRMVDKLEWTLPDEELSPYYFGGITTKWEYNCIPLEMNEYV